MEKKQDAKQEPTTFDDDTTFSDGSGFAQDEPAIEPETPSRPKPVA